MPFQYVKVYPGTWVHILKPVDFPSNLVPSQCNEKFVVTPLEKLNELLVVLANSEDLPEMSGCEIECGVRGGAHTYAGKLLCVGPFLTALLPNLSYDYESYHLCAKSTSSLFRHNP